MCSVDCTLIRRSAGRKRCELVIAGRNPVAVDACAARVMGFRPFSIRHINLCHGAGLGPVDYKLATDVSRLRLQTV